MTVTNSRESDFDNDSIDRLIEEGIIELIDLFRKNPTQFEYEIELCHQFHDILVKKLYKIDEFKIRWELKSKKPYKKKEPSAESKFYAKYDICLIKDNSEVVPYAFEFKLFRDLQYDNININYFNNTKFKEPIDDIKKLTNPGNKVEKGYVLVFARGNISSIYRGRIKKHKEKIKNYIKNYQDLVNLASTSNNAIKISCIYFGEIEGEEPIFNVFPYPDGFCAGINQKEVDFHK